MSIGPILRQNLANLIQHVEVSNLEIFGFVLFRTASSDKNTWNAFEKGVYELFDESIAAVPTTSGFSRLDDKVFIRIVADNGLDGQPPEGAARAYIMCMEQENEAPGDGSDHGWGDEITPGLTTSMCLMIDDECVRSVVNTAMRSTPLSRLSMLRWGQSRCWSTAG